ncbi:MAG TPA: carbamoyltransferase N-terminal domain-containing protein [Terriglobales bacterium]|nr:carbamoyltransferase N-terminal domain-containing protein [Terriglobales bacterium]
MNILGISCYYHDAAAALLRDGQLIAAAEEERFTRVKHDFSFPQAAIQFCLQAGGIEGRELDYVAFFEKPFRKFDRIMMTALKTYPLSYKVFRESMITWMIDKLWVGAKISSHLGIPRDRVLFCEHHLSHAASAFLCSPFEGAAILTVDGVGEWVTGTWGAGRGNHIELRKQMKFPHSLGLLYSAFTAFLGFEVNEGEYKVMGMAPYGKPRYVDKVWKLIRQDGDGSFSLDMDYFCFHHSTTKTFNGRFTQLFGEPRPPKMLFFTAESGFPTYFGNPPSNYNELCKLNQHYADIAASIQRVTEEVLLGMARHIQKETGLKRLCIAGGVGLNSVANTRILRETGFEELFVQPSAGDGGGALGAALWADNMLLGSPRRFRMDHAYWGKSYAPSEVREFLDRNSIPYQCMENDDRLMDVVVEHLQQGKVIGWFQDRFEWGPRALGNRSIIADPRNPNMKDIVNTKIKFREPYRPFAPSVLAEAAETYFDIQDAVKHYPARYMLYVVPVRPSKQELLPAITHVDGTGRLQTVFRDANPRYYQLIERFGQATGVPAVLNTSFNLKGEPIVNTPANAFNTFSKSEMDLLVLGNFIVEKDKIRPSTNRQLVACGVEPSLAGVP